MFHFYCEITSLVVVMETITWLFESNTSTKLHARNHGLIELEAVLRGFMVYIRQAYKESVKVDDGLKYLLLGFIGQFVCFLLKIELVVACISDACFHEFDGFSVINLFFAGMPFNISEVHVQGGYDAKEWPYKFCLSHRLDGGLFTGLTIHESSCLVTITGHCFLYSFAMRCSFGFLACLFVCFCLFHPL